jgi:hypothetical protein
MIAIGFVDDEPKGGATAVIEAIEYGIRTFTKSAIDAFESTGDVGDELRVGADRDELRVADGLAAVESDEVDLHTLYASARARSMTARRRFFPGGSGGADLHLRPGHELPHGADADAAPSRDLGLG